MTDSDEKNEAPVTIKKYANRRLYNTATSSYVTLDYLCQMVKEGIDFVVYDAKTGDDITRSVLTQIIVEEEGKGQNLLPISFLRQLISFYGDNMQHMLLPRYLEHSMQAFTRNQEQMQKYMRDSFGGMFPFGGIEEMGRKNMAMLEKTMQMFTPFGGEDTETDADAENGEGNAGESGESAAHDEKEQIAALERKLNDLQEQIASMTHSK